MWETNIIVMDIVERTITYDHCPGCGLMIELPADVPLGWCSIECYLQEEKENEVHECIGDLRREGDPS